ncbi:MAG: sodium-dependent transporter [Syntrophotaleaceae bacterium]
MNRRPTARSFWGTRFGFVLAAAGSAIGLGNIWKFPFIAGIHGGGAFVLVYLGCIVLVGLPIMLAEMLIGRQGQRDVVGSFAALSGKRSPWRLVGWAAVAASFILLSYYAVVAGWSFDYVFKSATGVLRDRSPDDIKGLFQALTASPGRMILWQGVFVLATVGIVLGGVRSGIERWSRILLPALFALLILLFLQGLSSPGGWPALKFMFHADLNRLTPEALLDALGHAFFTLSLGAGVMITYASYLDPGADLYSLSLRIVLLDTLVALLAALTIFSVAFSAGINVDSGPGLVFQTLPILLLQWPFGNLLALLFFVLLAFAALSSSISMLEVVVAYLIDERAWSRIRATLFTGLSAFLMGLPALLSFNLWAEVRPLFGQDVFTIFDTLVSSYLLPLGGLFVALYAGWFWSRESEKQALLGDHHGSWLYQTWHFLLRYVSPAAVIVVLLNQAGVFR